MTEAEAPRSGAEVLADIRPRRREGSTQLCLRPDLLDQWEELNEQLLERQGGRTSPRLGVGDSDASRELAEQIAALEDEIERTAVTFRFRSLSTAEFNRVKAEHPPRRNAEVDRIVGYHAEAVHDALVRKCLVDPVFDDDSWAELVDVLNPGEWKELLETVDRVNQSAVEVPKSELASRILERRAPE